MRIIIKKNNLLKALNHAQSIVERRNAIPILANVKIEAANNAVTLTTTDMDISITITTEATTNEAWVFTVPAITLYDIIKKISDDIDIIFELLDENLSQVILRFASSKFTLPTLPIDEFPNFELGDLTHKFQIDTKTLYKLLYKTKHAISHEETRYYLNGIYFHSTEHEGVKVLRAIATDGHRLAKTEAILTEDINEIPGIIIPKKAVNEILKLAESYSEKVNIGLSNNKAIFEIDNFKLITKLIDGKFPDYNRVIPTQNDKTFEIPCRELAKSIDLVISISNDKTRAIKFNIEPGKVILSASSEMNGNASGRQIIDVNYNDQSLSLGFNSKYVLDSLSAMEGDTVTFKLANDTGAVIALDNIDKNSLYILMPMRV